MSDERKLTVGLLSWVGLEGLWLVEWGVRGLMLRFVESPPHVRQERRRSLFFMESIGKMSDRSWGSGQKRMAHLERSRL